MSKAGSGLFSTYEDAIAGIKKDNYVATNAKKRKEKKRQKKHRILLPVDIVVNINNK